MLIRRGTPADVVAIHAVTSAVWEPDGELVTAALGIAGQVPRDPESRGPGLAFEPVLPVPAGTPDGDRLLGRLDPFRRGNPLTSARRIGTVAGC